jgi:hypothetical protein
MHPSGDIRCKQLFAHPEVVCELLRAAIAPSSLADLLCQDLLRQQRVRNQRLPLLLPLVLYTGREPWTAPTDLNALHDAASHWGVPA